MNEKEIIKGCMENYIEFQKALYERYYGKMLSLCLRYSGNETEAREIVKEGFLHIYASIKTYKDTESLDAWMKQQMIYAIINHIRNDKEKRMIVSTVHENKGPAKTREKAKEWTDDTIIANINKYEILKSIQELTSGLRIVFNLFVIDGFTHPEIASILNISEDTSKTNLEKSRFAFKKNLIQHLENNNAR